MKLQGSILKGRRVYDRPTDLIIANQEIGEGKRFTETIEREKKQRTLKQNAHYWAVLEPCARHYLNAKREREGATPLDRKQVHAVLWSAFGGMEETELGPVYVSSTTYDTKSFALVEDKIERWLNTLGYRTDGQAEADWRKLEADEAAGLA